MSAPMTAAKTVLSKYATFSGRATRSEFWWWVLCAFIILSLTQVIDGALIAPMLGFEAFEENAGQPLSFLFALGLIFPNIAVGARRLHDIGKSGWWLLIGLIPVLGTLVLIYFYVQPSAPETNEFGPHCPFAAQ